MAGFNRVAMHKRLELDLRTVQSELRYKNFVHSSEILGPTGDYFLAKEHGYRRIDDFIFLHVLDFVVGQPYSLAMARKDLVCIQISTKGAYTRQSGDRTDLVGPAVLQVTNFPYSVSDAEAGTRLRRVLIVCDRTHLVDHFGVKLDQVPKVYRPIFTKKTGMPEALTLPTSSSTIANVDQIISCRHAEPIRSLYLQAKTAEIVCDVVSQINMLLTRRPVRLRTDQSKAQAIETAAVIYRRELHNPPTIEQLAFRVGLNRNELTAGFRSLLGVTPHAYVNMLRMEQARRLLQSEWLSISEIARRVGYEGYSSFSRAYRAHFGHAPSRSRLQQADLRQNGPSQPEREVSASGGESLGASDAPDG